MFRLLLAILAACFATVARAEPVPVSHKAIEAGWKQAECSVELKDEKERDGEDLGNGLKLVEVYCWRAAYQAGSILFAVDPKKPDDARLLRFQTWNGKRFEPTFSLTDPSYDPKTKKLSSAHKGRGVGDCGSIGNWAWSGAEFKMTAYWNKDKCDGKAFDTAKRWQVFPKRQ